MTAHVEPEDTQRAAEKAIRDSERYRAFIANSSEGIWRLEFDPPIDTSLPVGAQVDLAYATGRFAACNDVMARM
jgi:PAS domain-containing protein